MRAKRTQNANQNENKQSKKINLQTGVSVTHYTSQAKLWALRGCESTIKTVDRDYLHTLLNEKKNKFQEENHHFIFSVSYGEIP